MRRFVGATCVVVLLAGATLSPVWWMAGAGGPPRVAASGAVWPVFDADAARDGVSTAEQTVNAGNVNGLVLLWQKKLPSNAVADSTPVYQNGTLYFTTKAGTAVAMDRQTGNVLWHTSTSGPNYTTSSPALDPTGQWVYSYGLDGKVHKYATTNGQEAIGSGWPALITNMPNVEKGSSALNLANGYLYMTTGGYPGDQGHYEGHLVAVNLSSGNETVFNTLCSNIQALLTSQSGSSTYCQDVQSGVWARGGAVVDPTNQNVYIASGNGKFNGTTDWGDSVMELAANPTTLLDTYTPTNQQSLNSSDTDLGSSAPVLLPHQAASSTPDMAVQVGKDGVLRLLNRRNLSGQGRTGQLGGELATANAPGTCEVLTQPAVWTEETGAVWLFVANDCGLNGYNLATDGSGKSSLVLAWKQSQGGTSPIVVNGVLYNVHSGGLDARDPLTGSRLWSNGDTTASIGSIHWESPILVDSTLVVADESGTVTAFALGSLLSLPVRAFLPRISN